MAQLCTVSRRKNISANKEYFYESPSAISCESAAFLR